MKTCCKSKALRQLKYYCPKLTAEWDASKGKKDRIKGIEEEVLPNGNIFVDAALCLGLGTFEQVYDGYDEEEFENEESYVKHETERILRQLLAFETVVKCFRSKFETNNVHFQDPLFNSTDIEFLKGRGHIVLPFNWDRPKLKDFWSAKYKCKMGTAGLDPAIRPLMSNSTLIFAPSLDFSVQFEVAYTARPSLYFGNNLMGSITDKLRPYIVHYYPAEDYEDFVLTYEDGVTVKALMEGQLENVVSLQWLAHTMDENAIVRLQNRRLAVEKARKDRMSGTSNSFVPSYMIESLPSDSS